MALTNPDRSGAPMSDINTTPLIDVMLVLLIMIILTIPLATHSLEVDVPAGPPRGPMDMEINRLAVTADDHIVWNGTPVSQDELAANLRATTAMTPEPTLQYRPEPEASYELSAGVLAVIKRSKVTNFGFVGNEQFSEFGKPPVKSR